SSRSPLPRRGRGTPHRNLKTPNPRTARVPRLAPFVPASCPDAPVPRCLLLCHLSKPTSPHIRRDRATRYRACPRPSTTTPRYTPARAVTSPPGDGGAGGRGPPLPPASAHPTSVTPRNSRPTAPTPAQPPGAVHPPPAAASPKPNRDR